MKDRIQLLIEILLDRTASLDERDDAAMDLGECNDLRALSALVKIASKPSVNDHHILDVCGESIARILVKQNDLRNDFIDELPHKIKEEVLLLVKSKKPEWFSSP